jgi:hypothetical protein
LVLSIINYYIPIPDIVTLIIKFIKKRILKRGKIERTTTGE